MEETGVEGAYKCDKLLPTLQEWITRLRDINDGGLADEQHHALLYTGLVYGDGEDSWDKFTEWTAGWMKDKVENHDQNFYWWFEHVNPDCMLIPIISDPDTRRCFFSG